MPAITSWTRLEPVPRGSDLLPGARAELADPLWQLARQFQFGELSGEDAGSPIEAALTVEAAPVSRFHPGAIGTAGRAAADVAQDINDHTAPWEVLVERRVIDGTTADLRVRLDAGQHFLRMLTQAGAGDQRAPIVDAMRLAPPAGAQLGAYAITIGRVPDGRALADALRAHRGGAALLTSLPARLGVPATAAVLEAANAFLAFWEGFVSEPPAREDAWTSQRLEYGCGLQATMSDGHVTLRADGYRGGHLDWTAFEADTRNYLGPAPASVASRKLVRRSMPTRVFYAGMPAERFWEFEDDAVRFGAASVGRTDVAHLLLDEFALTYGNDWWVIPLRLEIGTLSVIRKLEIIDTFGIRTSAGPAASIGASRWRMFNLTPGSTASARAESLFLLPAALGASQQGEPVEAVGLLRDELANLVWAVERRLEAAVGGSREPPRTSATVAGQRPVGDVGDAELIYRMTSNVPENWFPLVPVRPRGSEPGVVDLQLRGITRYATDDTDHHPAPASRVLTAATPLVLHEEEVPREGVTATAAWQLARDPDGRYHLWLSHRIATGMGEGSSGLIFDVTRPPA